MKEFITIAENVTAEIVEKKSRFIGCAAPVSTEEEALAFIKEVKNKYKKARPRSFQTDVLLCEEKKKCTVEKDLLRALVS